MQLYMILLIDKRSLGAEHKAVGRHHKAASEMLAGEYAPVDRKWCLWWKDRKRAKAVAKRIRDSAEGHCWRPLVLEADDDLLDLAGYDLHEALVTEAGKREAERN